MKKLSTALACILLGTVLAVAAGPFSVSGRVLDKNDAAIQGVSIQAYRDQRALESPTTSAQDGRYEIKFSDGTPLDSVRYDHSDWLPAVVENISGKNSHTIYKTLLRRGSNLTSSQIEEVVCAFERIADLDKRNEQLAKNASDFHYKEALDEIEKLSMPIELRNRIKAIKSKYGIP
jgi:hypothetical protein